jgi:hypothetical protein
LSGVTSVVVLGHSGATGYDSDPARRREDVPENSWATGTNPAVDSVCMRLLAANPELDGPNFNLAADGSTAADLVLPAGC